MTAWMPLLGSLLMTARGATLGECNLSAALIAVHC